MVTSSATMLPPGGWERSDHVLSRAVKSCALYSDQMKRLTWERASGTIRARWS